MAKVAFEITFHKRKIITVTYTSFVGVNIKLEKKNTVQHKSLKKTIAISANKSKVN